MNLTKENKEKIDAMSYEQLLEHWRFAPAGDPWLCGQTGEYWKDAMHTRRNAPGGNEVHTNASKNLGWER